MSKKINIEKLNRRISECNQNAKMVNMINRSGEYYIKNGTMTKEMYDNIINANVVHGNKHVSTVRYDSCYLDGYQDCRKDTVKTVLASATVSVIGVGIITYRKELKAYGKYVIGKLIKRGDK